MKKVRFIAVLVIVVALGITSVVISKQQTRIHNLKKSRHGLAEQYQEVSATNASLASVDAARRNELFRLEQQSLEIQGLRKQLTLARKQLTAAAAENQTSRTDNSNELAGYITSEQLKYAGLGTPQDALQSLRWAEMNGDYTNWLASLSPQFQDEELANSNSIEEFQRRSSPSKIIGMQVLAAKPVGNDRVELKVRLDTENSVSIFVFPMIAIGNEWRLGDDIEPYTQPWDNPSNAQ